MKKLISCFVFLFIFQAASAQRFSFGPEISAYSEEHIGFATVADSLTVFAQSTPETRLFPSIFIETQLGNSPFSLRSGLSVQRTSSSFNVYNNQDFHGFSSPTNKVKTIGHPSIQLPLFLNVKLPILPIKLVGGVVTAFQFVEEVGWPSGDSNGWKLHPGVIELLLDMKETIRPVVFNYSLGARLDLGRFTFMGSYQQNLGQSYNNDIVFRGNTYPFRTTYRLVNLSLSYKFYSLRFKKKDRQ